MVTPVGFEVRPSASPAEFEAWLEAEHERAPGVHVEVARKAAGVPSITAAEAVEVALRFGWIDGRGNRVDDDRSTVRCTPRRAESVWSQEDVETVARLVAEGRMRPAGSATITVPDDLTAALAASPAAPDDLTDARDRTNRYPVLWRVQTTATPRIRANRIAAAVHGSPAVDGPCSGVLPQPVTRTPHW